LFSEGGREIPTEMVRALQGADLTPRVVCVHKKAPGNAGLFGLSEYALAAVAAMKTDRPNGLQIKSRHCRNDVEPGLALNAHRLESK
jgi:hypothetical protein